VVPWRGGGLEDAQLWSCFASARARHRETETAPLSKRTARPRSVLGLSWVLHLQLLLELSLDLQVPHETLSSTFQS
jgi:hypothetical protein